jgi:NADH-quinone oxidoreductase subunit G
MCDEGRFTYKAVHLDRLAAPAKSGEVTAWDAALAEAGRLLAQARDKSPSSLGVVLSAQATNEDLFAFLRLANEQLRTSRIYLTGNPEGWSDDILVSADKNPNTTGAKLIGGPTLRTAAELHQDLSNGSLNALLVIDGAGVTGPFDKLDALVAVTSHQGPLSEAAHVALPLSMWAEVDGSIVNRQGKVQRLRPAVESPGQAQPGWIIANRLAKTLGADLGYSEAKQVFAEACGKVALMGGAEWGKLEIPIQLRFANTRG